MAKEREQKIARLLYVEQGKTAKEISALVGVSEQTLTKWVSKFGWRDQRNALIANPGIREDNIRQLINELSEQRLELSRQLRDADKSADTALAHDLRKQMYQIDDAVSKWNKTLINIKKETQISLATYLNVMEMLFDALRQHDEKKYLGLLDFQEQHLNDVSLRFK